MNLNPCWQWRTHAQGLPLGSWWTNWLSKAIVRASQKKGLKCKACNVYRADRQFSFWNRTLLCPSAMCGRSHLPIQKREMTAQRVHRRFGLRQIFFSTAGSRASAPTRQHETSAVESGQGAANLFSKCEVGLVVPSAQVGCHMDRFSLLVSPEPESDVAHTRQFCVCASPSQVGEQCDGVGMFRRSRTSVAWMASRKLESAKGVVNTPR